MTSNVARQKHVAKNSLARFVSGAPTAVHPQDQMKLKIKS